LSETLENPGEALRDCFTRMQSIKSEPGTNGTASTWLLDCFTLLSHFPSPALPGSGRMGMISARCIKAPLMI